VPAICQDDPVAAIERRTDADRHRLLADIAMHDAIDLAGQIVGRQVRREALGWGMIPPGRSGRITMGQRRKGGNRNLCPAPCSMMARLIGRAYDSARSLRTRE
jgi:hypothetical protein